VTFKIEGGQQYRSASVAFQSSIATLDGNAFSTFSRVNVGSLYSARPIIEAVRAPPAVMPPATSAN
jgi:outer membrane protein insertion porin family